MADSEHAGIAGNFQDQQQFTSSTKPRSSIPLIKPLTKTLVPEKSRLKKSGLPTFKKPVIKVENDPAQSVSATKPIKKFQSKMKSPHVVSGSDKSIPKGSLHQSQVMPKPIKEKDKNETAYDECQKKTDVQTSKKSINPTKPSVNSGISQKPTVINVEKENYQSDETDLPFKGKQRKSSGVSVECNIPKKKVSTLQIPKYSTGKHAPEPSKISQGSKLSFSSPRKLGEPLQLQNSKTCSPILKPRSVAVSTLPTSKISKFQPLSEKKPIILRKRSLPSSISHSSVSCLDDNNGGKVSPQLPLKQKINCQTIKHDDIKETNRDIEYEAEVSLSSINTTACNVLEKVGDEQNDNVKERKKVATIDGKERTKKEEEKRNDELMSVVAKLLERKKSIEVKEECNKNQKSSVTHLKPKSVSKDQLLNKEVVAPVFNKVEHGQGKLSTSDYSNGKEGSLSNSGISAINSTKNKTFGYSPVNTKRIVQVGNSIAKNKNDIDIDSDMKRQVLTSVTLPKADEKRTLKPPLKKTYSGSTPRILPPKTVSKPLPNNFKEKASLKAPNTLQVPSRSQQRQLGKLSTNKPTSKPRPVSSTLQYPVKTLSLGQAEKQKLKRTSSISSKSYTPEPRKIPISNKPSFGFNKVKTGESSPSCRIVKPVIRPQSVKKQEYFEIKSAMKYDEEIDKVTVDSKNVASQALSSRSKKIIRHAVLNHNISEIMASYSENVKPLIVEGFPQSISANVSDKNMSSSNVVGTTIDFHQKNSKFKDGHLNSDDFNDLETDNYDIWTEIKKESQIISQNLSDVDNQSSSTDTVIDNKSETDSLDSIASNSQNASPKSNVMGFLKDNVQTDHDQFELPISTKRESEFSYVSSNCKMNNNYECKAPDTMTHSHPHLPPFMDGEMEYASDLQKSTNKTLCDLEKKCVNPQNKIDNQKWQSSIGKGATEVSQIITADSLNKNKLLDDEREFEELERLINLEESHIEFIDSSDDDLSSENIICSASKSIEFQESKHVLEQGTRDAMMMTVKNKETEFTYLSKSAPTTKISSKLNNSFMDNQENNDTDKVSHTKYTGEKDLHATFSASPPRKMLGFDYTPPYAINIPTLKYPVRGIQTCPTSPTFSYQHEQEDDSFTDFFIQQNQLHEKSTMLPTDLKHKQCSSFTCPSTPSFGQPSERFIFPIDEERLNEHDPSFHDADLSSQLMPFNCSNIETHLDEYNDKEERTKLSSTESSTHSYRGDQRDTNKADWRLEPSELQLVLEKVKAEREQEDINSTQKLLGTINARRSFGRKQRSRTLPRPSSWNGMTDSGIERQMGMIKPQNAGHQSSYRDRFLETDIDFDESCNKMFHNTNERKSYTPGSPTELVWPGQQQEFRNKRSNTVDSTNALTINHAPGIIVTVDSSRNNQGNSQESVSPVSTQSSGVFGHFEDNHIGPRSSTPIESVNEKTLKPVQRRRSNSLTRAIDEGRLDIADESDLRPLDIENDFHLISQITEMNQKMLLNHSRCNSPQNDPSLKEVTDAFSSSTNCLNYRIQKPTQKWNSLNNSKSGLRSAPASTRITPVSTPIGSPGLKHKNLRPTNDFTRITPVSTPLGSPGLRNKHLRPTNDCYSTLTRFMDLKQYADTVENHKVEQRTLSSRSKEKRRKIRSLHLDQSKIYQSNIGISSPDLVGTQGDRSNVDEKDLSIDKFIKKSSSLQRFGHGLQHKPVKKMYSDSMVDKNRDKAGSIEIHKPLIRVSGVCRDLPIRSTYSQNDRTPAETIEDQIMSTKTESLSDSSSLTSFESSGNLSNSLTQPISSENSIEQCQKDAANKSSTIDNIDISTAVVKRRPKGRNYQRPKSTPNFDMYRIDSPSSSSRESSQIMEDEKPSLKAKPPKPRRAPRRSKSDLGGKNTIKAALKAAERAAMKEATDRELIEKAAKEILMNAERLTEKEQSRTLTRRSSGTSVLTNGSTVDGDQEEEENVVQMRKKRGRAKLTRPLSDLGPIELIFDEGPVLSRNRKGSIPIVLHRVDSPRVPIKRSQSTPGDLDKKNLFNASNQLQSNDRHPDVILSHSRSTDTIADDMFVTTMHSMTEDDVLVYGEALWDHVTMDEDELAFNAGDVVGVTDMQDKEWWWGHVDDQEGWFPASFVRIRVNQIETVEEHFAKMKSGQLITDDAVRRTSMSFLSKRQVRTNVVMEILNTEKDYNKHLKDLCEGYVKQARKRPEMFSEEVIQTIFGNIEDIYVFQCRFLRKLTKRINQEEPHKSEIGSCFLRYKDGFSIYAAYCSNHSRAITELRQLLRRQRYKHFFEACRLLQAMIEIRIDGFLLTPVQRICKYPLQLAELLKYTDTDHPDYNNVKQALETMRNVAFEINEQKRLIENIEKIAQWQKSIEGWEGKDVLEVSTQSLHSGEVFKISHSGLRRTGRVLFLFDHQLILCKRDILWRSQLVYKNRINLDACSFQDVVDTKDIRNAWKIIDHELGKTYIFCTKSPEEKQKWMKAFHRERGLIHEEEERGIMVSISAREAAMKNAALTEKPVKPSDTLLKRKVPLMPYEYQHEIIKPNVKRMVLPRGISSSDANEVDTSKRRLLNWFFKGKR